MLSADALAEIAQVRGRCAPARARFHTSTEGQRGQLLASLRESRDGHVRAVLGDGPRESLRWLELDTAEYLAACDWALLDTVALAASLGLDSAVATGKLVGPVLVYQAIRMIDDVVDGHRSYKGRYETLYGRLYRHFGETLAGSLNLLVATGLALRGAGLLDETAAEAARRTILGMLLEAQDTERRGVEDYMWMVDAKMVSYSRLIYGPVLEAAGEQLAGAVAEFFDSSFVLGQVLNDLEDLEDDASRGQPNFWSSEGSGGTPWVLDRFGRLVALSAELPGGLAPYAHARVADLAQYALDIDAERRPIGEP